MQENVAVWVQHSISDWIRLFNFFIMKIIYLQFANSKIAFINGNRSVNEKRLLESIRKNGVLRPIDVIPYSEIKDCGITLVDVNSGKPVENPTDDYYIVLDGQHRLSCAFKLYQERMKKQEEETGQDVPCADGIKAILYNATDLNGMSPLTFISEINSGTKCWSLNDFIDSARVRKVNDTTLDVMHTLKKGLHFSDSNVGRGLFFDHKALKPSSISDYADGKADFSGLKCERGLEVLRLLIEKGFSMNFLKKRYMLESIIKKHNCDEFNSYLTMIKYLNRDTVNVIENKMNHFDYDHGQIMAKIEECFKNETLGKEVEPFELDTSIEKYHENLDFLHNIASELKSKKVKKDKSKAPARKAVIDTDIVASDIH